MNTARFLFCLNSDDPDIVAQGLEEFRDQVLKDHDAVASYGYHGRGSSDHVMESLRPQVVVTTVGVLASFIKSSPQLEELFILWGLPGRDDDKPLSSSHMSCMAVILHAATSNSNFCGTIVNRILHEHAKSIISQLSCGNLSLVHSTLALVLAMCRSSPQNCRDTFQKLVAISLPVFSTLLQQGKTISWEAEKQTDSTQSPKLKTDSRLLLVITVLTAVEAADQSSGSEILSAVTALLKRITNSITKDAFFVVQLILEGLISIRKQPTCEQLIGSKLVDLRFQDNLLYMYRNDDVKVQRIVHMFVLDHSSHLVNGMSKGGRGLTSGSAKASALQLLRHLEGHRDLRHREVQTILLRAQPSLIAKSIGSVVLPNWEPHPTVQYYCALAQLTFLCSTVDVDSQFKTTMKSIAATASSDSSTEKDRLKAEGSVRGVVTAFVQAMIPVGFQKKDISKLLQHKNCLLQRSGLLYVLAVMQRLVKATAAAASAGAGRAVKLEASMAAAVHKLLPDFQLLLNIRLKYSKTVSGNSSAVSESAVSTTETEEMDVEGGASDLSGEKEKTLYLLSLLLRIIEAYIKTVPSLVAQAGFELTRLIDEVVPWSPKQSAHSAMGTLTAQIKNLSTILRPVIRALKHATTSRHCKWFGTTEDCVKALTQLVVNQDWDKAVKRSPFAKLLLLSKCRCLEVSDPELSSSAKSLVKSILKQSGMFQGHGEVDLELRTEQASWLEAIAVKDKSILLLDCILRLAYHWNTETCIDTTDRIGKYTSGQGYQVERPTVRSKGRDSSVVAPISPVMSCAMNLCSSNFDNVSSRLPRHIKVHVDTLKGDIIAVTAEAAEAKEGEPSVADSCAFLMKYSTGFRSDLQELLLGVAVTSALKARNPESYGQCLLAVTGREGLPGGDGGFYREMSNMTTLLSVSPSTSAIPSNKKAANSAAHLPHIIQDIAGRADITSTIMLGSVLEKALKGATITPSNAAKRTQKQGISSDLDKDNALIQVKLHSATIAFVVHNIEQVQTCYNTFVSDESSVDNGRVGSFLRCVDAVGLFSAYVCCCQGQGQGQLGIPFYQFISALAVRKRNQSVNANEGSELEQKATTIVECVRLLRVICDRYSLAVNPSVQTKSRKAGNDVADLGTKRKTRSGSVDEQDGGIRSAISEAASMVTSLVVELVRQTSCAPLVADALNSTSLLDGMTDPNSFGKYSRSILCAAASAYFRRTNSRSKKILDPNSINGTEHVTPALWLRISERLLLAQEAMDTATAAAAIQNSGSDIFSLGWMVQHFVDNSVLRSKFVDLALRDGQGHSLLSLNLKVAATASPSFALIPLDAVCVSVLQSASAATLAMALNSHSLIDTPAEGDDGTSEAAKEGPESGSSPGIRPSNALSCVSVRLESNACTSLPCVSSFISPLSLMKVAGDRTLESQIRSPNAIYRLAPLCATLIDTDKSSPCPCKAFFALTLPICLGKKDLSLWDAVKVVKDGDFGSGLPVIPGTRSTAGQTISTSQRHILLRFIEETNDSEKGARSVSSVCRLLWHSSVVNSSYTACLLATYAQSQLGPSARHSLVQGPVAAVAICCSLSDVLLTGGDVVALWCDAYLGFICDLLDESVNVLTALETNPLSIAEQLSQISSQCSLLQSMLMISIKPTAAHRATATLIMEKLSLKGSEVKKKMNKWIKSCLKFGLHYQVVMNGLSSFFSAARKNFLSSVSTGSVPLTGEYSIWKSVFAPKTVDYYHPSLVLQMMVSHSRFSATLRGQKQLTPNLSLLRLLLVLLSIVLPALEVPSSHPVSLGDRNEAGSGSDQFLVNCLLQMYQGTVSDSDRLILRILHLLNTAGKCLALCTLKPVSMQSKKSFKGSTDTGGSLIGTILQQLVYSTVSQYPTWRACAPQAIDIEGSDAEKSYRLTYSSLVNSVNNDWSGEETADANQSMNKEGRSAGRRESAVPHDSSDDSDTDSEGGDAHHSDTDSVLSIVSVEKSTSDWNCDDSDTYIPSVDSLSLCTDKVYDPCFWLPALHYSLLQQAHSVRQLANSGALSLVIAGTSSRCPVLRAIAMSSLQRIFELAKQQTPDKDAGFRERPQLLLLLNFLRNALDSCNSSSSGPIQFPSVISLFLSRAALHLLQPTHELFSKINKYLLSRPFCDFKDVPLYDLLLVDGDATTEQASRLTTFRIVRDGLTTRWDHLNLCRKNGYNRLMLLFPVLSKDVRAGHAVFDLLDKALGMQVSARYLLERCCVIPWLQQMASPSNSLDIDTTRSAGGSRMKTSEESEPSEGVEDADPRGRGARSAVSRSHASVLLAAPPRLLPRALCLMRRALGASYLLSAGSSSNSSTHLDQMQLSITTLIDDVIAVDRVGMATEIPSEFFRQLVLLMWDYAMCSSGGGGHGLKWGVDRVHLLALATLHSRRSNDDHAVDDLVVSLLSLLAFQTSSPLHSSAADNSRYTDVTEMVLGCALKHLIVPKGVKKGDYVITQPASLIAPSSAEPADTVNYHSVVNILSEDNSRSNLQKETEMTWTFNMADGPVGAWKSPDEGGYTDLSLLLHESWEQMAQTGYESMTLPTSMGEKLILFMSVKAVLALAVTSCGDDDLSLCRNLNSSTPSVVAGPLFPVGVARWALAMRAAFLCPAPTALNMSSSLSMRQSSSLMKRVLSSADGSPFNSFSTQFCDFQLTFRLAVLALSSVSDALEGSEGLSEEGAEIAGALRTALMCLLRLPSLDGIEGPGLKSARHIFLALTRSSSTKSNSANAVDGSSFWEHSAVAQKLSQRVCSLALELCAALVSAIDRNTTLSADAAIQHDSVIKTAVPGDGGSGVCGRSMAADAAYLSATCKYLSGVVSAGNAAESLKDTALSASKSHVSLTAQECFEPMPGKSIAMNQTKRSTVLFDRSSSVWRQGCGGSMDRVLASMRAVQHAPLCGIQATAVKALEDIDEDDGGGGDGDESDQEMGVDEDDDDNEDEDEEDDEEDVLALIGSSSRGSDDEMMETQSDSDGEGEGENESQSKDRHSDSD